MLMFSEEKINYILPIKESYPSKEVFLKLLQILGLRSHTWCLILSCSSNYITYRATPILRLNLAAAIQSRKVRNYEVQYTENFCHKLGETYILVLAIDVLPRKNAPRLSLYTSFFFFFSFSLSPKSPKCEQWKSIQNWKTGRQIYNKNAN